MAVKTYKKKNSKAKPDELTLQKFRQQVQVLSMLQEAIVQPKDESLWCSHLSKAKPPDLFLQLLDFSKNEAGEPADEDGELYIVTEIGNHSLKDALDLRAREERPWELEQIQKIAAALILVVAGLHTKGFVHLDLKPNNFMFFGDRVKLIDVGGCIAIGTDLAKMERLLVSFSPCYCAPEWAGFLFDWFGDDKPEEFRVTPSLDAWSLGIVLCELAELSPILMVNFNAFRQERPSEARWLFLEWLSGLDEAPMPESVASIGSEFQQLVSSLMQCQPTLRRSAAECIYSLFFSRGKATPLGETQMGTSVATLFESSLVDTLTDDDRGKMSVFKADRGRVMSVDDSVKKPLHMGTLWKLKAGGVKTEAQDWKKSDFWISSDGSLCYYSHQLQKRLVFFDHAALHCVKIQDVEGVSRGHGFELRVPEDTVEGGSDPIVPGSVDCGRKQGTPATPHGNKRMNLDDDCESVLFATETPEEREVWKAKIAKVHSIADDAAWDSLNLGDEDLVQDLVTFKLKARNRRQKLHGAEEAWDPVWKSALFKLKQEGEIMNAEDWREREFWISKNSYLVYRSVKDPDGKPLVYYTDEDLETAVFDTTPDAESSKLWSFSVTIGAQADGTLFEPGQFAAASEAERERWLEEFRKLRDKVGPMPTQKKPQGPEPEVIPGSMPDLT